MRPAPAPFATSASGESGRDKPLVVPRRACTVVRVVEVSHNRTNLRLAICSPKLSCRSCLQPGPCPSEAADDLHIGLFSLTGCMRRQTCADRERKRGDGALRISLPVSRTTHGRKFKSNRVRNSSQFTDSTLIVPACGRCLLYGIRSHRSSSWLQATLPLGSLYRDKAQ
jgi:hypothetical protein